MGDLNVAVLVVDDNDAQRLALASVLTAPGVNVVQASSGREALRRLLDGEFAVILLDVNMPGLDGFETAELIRQRQRSARTPIIFVTACADDAYASRGYSLGAVDYILAPVQANVLRTKVSVFIELYRQAAELTRQREALRRYANQLHRLTDASVAVNQARSAQEILEVVVDTVMQIIGVEYASMTAASDAGTPRLSAVRCSARYEASVATPQLPETIGLSSQTGPLRLTQAQLDAHPMYRSLPIPVPTHGPVRGYLAAALPGRDGIDIGVLQLCDKREGEFSDEDEVIVVQLAQMASIAIENVHASEAREANRLKDEFLTVLSHELRSPLQAIMTWVHLLRSHRLEPAKAARGLEVIEASARAQAQLIDDLLDVSRIIRGKLHLEPRRLELRALIETALEAMKPAAAAKKIELQWTAPSTACHITGDPRRLYQVVLNLLSNAIKFTPSGGWARIRLLSDKGVATIEVRDSGPGIPPEFLPHVFDRFRQADSRTTRAHGGLGLGLAIVRHLVELHRGHVEVENAPDGGAVFTITLPLGAERVEAAELTAAAAAPLPMTPTQIPRLDGVRILLVDDERDTRESLAVGLQGCGAEVTAVASVADALIALGATRPDILLSDVAMPHEDGYSLIRKVRAQEDGNRLPAAAISAYARPEDRTKALLAGFDTHIRKPAELAEVAMVIKRLATHV